MSTFSHTVKRAWNQNHLLSVLLELTYACNLNCSFCYNDLSLRGERLTKEQYFDLLADLERMGVLNLTLSGGEPLAHPDFFAIGARAKTHGFAIRIKSNGHAIRKAVAKRIRDEIDPFLIEVSLHGASAAVHDKQTQVVGSFERLMANFGHMRDEELRVRINATLTRWNEHEIEGMYAIADQFGFVLQFDNEVKPRDDGDRTPLDIAASPEGQHRLIRIREERSAKVEKVLPAVAKEEQRALAVSLRAGVTKHCGAGSATLTVDPFGDVLPCVQWRRTVGNIHKSRVHDIWAKSDDLADVRRITTEVKSRVEAEGVDGANMNFCPGAAHTYSGNPLEFYPAARERARIAGEARVRLTVL